MKHRTHGKLTSKLGSLKPEPHEYETVEVFTSLGHDVEFLRPHDSKGLHTPDIAMDGILWEIKSPTGKSKYTIQNQFKRAAKQSKSVIIDTRRLKMSQREALREIKKQSSIRKTSNV